MKKINDIKEAEKIVNAIKEGSLCADDLIGAVLPKITFNIAIPELHSFVIITKDGMKIHSLCYDTKELCFYGAYNQVNELGINNIKLLTLKTT